MQITSSTRRLAALFAATAIVTAGCAVPPADSTSDGAPDRKWGYLDLPDGNRMRYSVLLPDTAGPHPVLVEYDGYAAGSDPMVGKRWLSEGYAIVGVNVPGTGCSTGDDEIFGEAVGSAGAAAVEWAAKQPWSNGRVGMVGYSYSGFNQLWTAAQRPTGLVAITPSKSVADPYRDVAYPGGIQNTGFPSRWWGNFPGYWEEAARIAADDGDTECAATAPDNIAKAQRPDIDLETWFDNDPFYGPRYASKSAVFHTGRIDVPALATQSWQDEQVGPRAGYYESTMDPANMWLVSSNGNHDTDLASPDIDEMLKRFLAHFVKGDDNGFEQEPHVKLLQELRVTDSGDRSPRLDPTAVADFDRLPVHVRPMRMWLQPDGGLGAQPPTASDAFARYRYPVDSPAVNATETGGWSPVTAPDGQLTFTTGALPEDLSFYGEGSADLWLGATAPDTDLQVTVSEVRPDGQEMYVQRSWLRASQRALDEARSTELRPVGNFTEAEAAPLIPGEPTPMRVEIRKFAHVFRAGSSVRITIDTPSQTGFWEFGRKVEPSTNTIWFDATRPSSIVLGHLPYAHASELPACGRTAQQPCRSNELPITSGPGPRPPA